MNDRLTRNACVERLHVDLIGPEVADELIGDRPADRYVTGILYPQKLELPPDEDDSLEVEEAQQRDTAGAGSETVAMFTTVRPASAGVSFVIGPPDDGVASIRLKVRFARYIPVWLDEDGEAVPEDKRDRRSERWQRMPHEIELPGVLLESHAREIDLADQGAPGVQLYIRTAPWEGALMVTAALVNCQDVPQDAGRIDIEQRTLFQTELEVLPGPGCRFRPRPQRASGEDEDAKIADLIYRESREFAVGHTCSASWAPLDHAEVVRSSWIPLATVGATSSAGDSVFRTVPTGADNPLSARWLSVASADELGNGLRRFVSAYSNWIERESAGIPDLADEYREQAGLNLDTCRTAQSRMQAGIDLLLDTRQPQVLRAFQLANRAMLIQTCWRDRDDSADLVWRPFQLGFMLLTLASTANRQHGEREVMDLLWFPTGGGKTEAYLALTAFTLFHRRLSATPPDVGAGVSAIMRYTLRLLTIQQFQRAAAVICACEHLRRGGESEGQALEELGKKPFSLGLWVGGGATPNTWAQAAQLEPGASCTPAQITECPACRNSIRWSRAGDGIEIYPTCTGPDCPLATTDPRLPLWTVDEGIYAELPSLIIGTVDKFAQIVRNPQTGRLFGLNTSHEPPDLIIQDELHLISGPLGTLSALYEVAIDELCTRDGVRPKLIGSTATIRRARQQIKDLFDRTTFQFPPQGLDAGNSCFAVEDKDRPGRLYAAVTTAGRSPKFVLQAVCASLLQSASSSSIPSEERDVYWTLVGYFNSLRELGGALVLVEDDVSKSVEEYARRRGEEARILETPAELTSRVSSAEIPELLSRLEKSTGETGAYDVLLASNMISVGVDIPRLNLMLVNGQPKGISEYIQATSRVGRQQPGLVISVQNAGKVRDRSHFETFPAWHRTLYREVEPTSVTPFASRSQDRALHAVIVALARHLVPGMLNSPRLEGDRHPVLERLVKRIMSRANRIDPSELAGLEKKVQDIIERWKARAAVSQYWNDRRRDVSLLLSAELAAALRAAGRSRGAAWPTPNSMREVEPGVRFTLRNRLR